MPTRIHSSSRFATTLAVAGVLVAGAASMAQSAPTTDKPAAPAPTAPDSAAKPDLLGGPRVVDKPAKTSLVERDGGGKLVRLEVRPEQAALDLLGLTRAEREPADKVLAERMVKVSQLLKDNQALFAKIQTARQGGAKPQEIAPLMREFRPIALPLIEKPLGEQVAATLPEAKRADFQRLVTEYVQAAMAEEAANRAAAGGDGAMPGARPSGAPPVPQQRVEMNLLLREMGGVLRTIVKERREQTEELVRAIDATPGQQAQIQAITRDTKYGEGFERTPQQMGDIKRRIDAVLTPEQRQKLEEYRRAQRGGGPAMMPAEK
ncbi:MAG: hypothetical protein ACREJO_16855 [Phycisphaerales bacterium]